MGLEHVWKTSSERPQWTQRTHAILPIGNWDGRSEGCALLDDGSFWVNINRKQHVFQDNEGGSQWMGTMSPEGNLQYTGDLFTRDPSLDSPAGSTSWVDKGYLPRLTVVQFTEDFPFVTDGRYIFYAVAGTWPGNGRLTLDGMRFYRIDPATAMTEWVAGSPPGGGTDYPTRDSHDGKSAHIPYAFYGQGCDREYIYWAQYTDNPTTYPGMRIRRMKLQPPYPVDTLPGLISNPGWYSSPNDKKIVNPATGLARMYDSNFAGAIRGIAVRDDYLYFFDQNFGGAALRRMPKTGGAVTTLMWAGERDGISDYLDTPGGQNSFGSSYIYPKGTPELEGIQQRGAVKFLGNKLFFKNVASGSFLQFYNLFGQSLAYIDIDKMEADYARIGPQRVNRENPQWRTVHGGSHHFDQRSFYTPIMWQIQGGHVWGWVDGGERPLHENVFDIFDVNVNAPGWENRVAFVHSEIANMAAPTGRGNATMNTMVAAWVEPQITGSQYKLTLQFTGDLLKGYAPVRDMGPASAPKEITLG